MHQESERFHFPFDPKEKSDVNSPHQKEGYQATPLYFLLKPPYSGRQGTAKVKEQEERELFHTESTPNKYLD